MHFAPMEGLTGHIYRQAHRKIFRPADVYYTPFLSPTRDHVFTPKERREILPENNEGIRLVPQLMTNKAEDFLWAAGELAAMGYDEVNLNLGCPSGTVVAKKKGSGFLAFPQELDGFFAQVFDRAPCAVSVKTRLGKNSPEEFSRILEIFNRYPIKLLTIHPRVQTDFYKNTPNLDAFAEALSGSRNPVCYNGNLFTPKDILEARSCFPKCSHIMLGRGLLANPALLESADGQARSREKLRQFHGALLEAYGRQIREERNLLFKMKELWFYMIRSFGDGDCPGTRARLEKKMKKAQRLSEFEKAAERAFCELELPEEYDLRL